jgi:hypothetical protein
VTATLSDYAKWKESQKTENLSPSSNVSETDAETAFEARKQSLLQAIANGGADIEQDIEDPHGQAESLAIDGNFKNTPEDAITSNGYQSNENSPALPVATHAELDESLDPAAVGFEVAKRRAKLDLASSRRLLFGSLGFKTPKTKVEEYQVREKLMLGVRKPKEPQKPLIVAEDVEAAVDDDSWKDKVVLKAVECCYECIDLSTPPFPFVQRWDPQQQGRPYSGKSKQCRKRKRSQRKDHGDEYYEDDGQGEDVGTVQHSVSLIRDQTPNSTSNKPGEEAGKTQCTDEKLLRDISESWKPEEQSLADLPELPGDISSRISLVLEFALPGAIVAFKQLEMSQATNWQPQYSSHRIALIDQAFDDGRLELTMARRDRPAKTYDELTGERVYSKFEMPDIDDADDDSGFVEMYFVDMIEPKLIKEAPASLRDHSRHTATASVEIIDMSAVPDIEDEPPQSDELGSDQGTQDLPTTFARVQRSLATRIPEAEVEVSEDTRQEISVLIKDAGFRLDIPSDIDRGFDDHSQARLESEGQESLNNVDTILSPRFNGFDDSSPLPEKDITMTDATVQVPKPRHKDSSGVVDVRTSASTPRKSSPAHKAPKTKKATPSASIDEDRALDFDQADEGNLEPLPNHMGAGNNKKNQQASSPVPDTRFCSTKTAQASGTIASGTGILFGDVDGSIDVDEDLPTLEDLLGPASSQPHPGTPSDSSSALPPEFAGNVIDKLASTTGDRDMLPRLPDRFTDVSSSEDENFESSPPTQRLRAEASQVVDLTLSSDYAPESGSEDEEQGKSKGVLPMGPGWVKKKTSASSGKWGGGTSRTVIGRGRRSIV